MCKHFILYIYSIYIIVHAILHGFTNEREERIVNRHTLPLESNNRPTDKQQTLVVETVGKTDRQTDKWGNCEEGHYIIWGRGTRRVLPVLSNHCIRLTANRAMAYLLVFYIESSEAYVLIEIFWKLLLTQKGLPWYCYASNYYWHFSSLKPTHISLQIHELTKFSAAR